ncbi:MAG: DEAD/DEAH box helicase [Mariprofundaceae bacterium]
MKFSELALPKPLLEAIDDLGFTELTPVQEEALPIALKGKDIAAQGRTGTGKTATFLITAMTRLLTQPPRENRAKGSPRALIIAPTRELVIQIAADAKIFSRHTDLKLHVVYGGVDYEKQMNAFSEGVDILVGTPGRLIDYFKKGCFALKTCEMMVVDEADRMFDLGFIKDIRYLMRRLPKYHQRQSMLFSATLSHRVLELAYEHMNNPVKLRAEEGDLTAEGVVETLYHTAMEEKLPLLISLLRQDNVQRGIVFINLKRTGEAVARELARYGFAVGILSGDVRQKKRMRILEQFTKGELHLIVATDVASRGLHVDDITHVFNFDLPEDAQDYVHRIGRTARAGGHGIAISFACEKFCFGLPDIEAYIGHTIPVPEWDHGRLNIGAPTTKNAIAEGMGSEDREQPREARKKTPSGEGRPRNRRRRTGS